MKKEIKRGFFLIETMVVIGIVGIIITFLFTTFSNLYTFFNSGEYFDTIEATNAASQVRSFLENRKYIVEEEVDENTPYIEITNLAELNDTYFVALKNNLNISRVFIINKEAFFNGNSINDFSISARQYLESIKEDIAIYKIFVITKNNSFGSVALFSYSLVLEGDRNREYVSYLLKDDIFMEPGYTAIDSKGNEMDVVVTGYINNEVPGIYYLTYNLGILNMRRKVIVYEEKYEFPYTGGYQVFQVPLDGTYKVELWGAGVVEMNDGDGKGAYTSGEIYLFEGQTFYVYVGEQGKAVKNVETFNGGISNSDGYPGGGATDIRLVYGNWKEINSLRSRIMVVGGAGSGYKKGAHGGELIGLKSGVVTGGTQTEPGNVQNENYFLASFGIGGGGCGGGGGYYGGGGANCSGGGAGGSSFISGYTGCNAITKEGVHTDQTVHYSGFKFNNAVMKAGDKTFLSPEGVNEIGHSGNGYARITLVEPNEKNNLSGVRYIYVQSNGSTSNKNNHYVEVQAYDLNGTNVALNKPISAASYRTGIESFWKSLTDGVITSSPYISLPLDTAGPLAWAIVDLEEEYVLSSIRVWRYYDDFRRYYNTETRVAGSEWEFITPSDLQTLITIDNLEYKETPDGRIIRP